MRLLTLTRNVSQIVADRRPRIRGGQGPKTSSTFTAPTPALSVALGKHGTHTTAAPNGARNKHHPPSIRRSSGSIHGPRVPVVELKPRLVVVRVLGSEDEGLHIKYVHGDIKKRQVDEGEGGGCAQPGRRWGNTGSSGTDL